VEKEKGKRRNCQENVTLITIFSPRGAPPRNDQQNVAVIARVNKVPSALLFQVTITALSTFGRRSHDKTVHFNPTLSNASDIPQWTLIIVPFSVERQQQFGGR
jgi:hypothetical protein